jgi:hypothetical protein
MSEGYTYTSHDLGRHMTPRYVRAVLATPLLNSQRGARRNAAGAVLAARRRRREREEVEVFLAGLLAQDQSQQRATMQRGHVG